MKYPRIIINLRKIQHNTSIAADLCHKHGIFLMGVTKACLGSPEVARAMVAGGADGIGDSRIENLSRLREAGISCPLTMLRLPMISELSEVVRLADTSLNSCPRTIRRLSEVASVNRLRHGVVLMVDTGDGREGLRVMDIGPVVEEINILPGIYLAGLGTNVACLAGSVPTPDNLRILTGAAGTIPENTRPARTIVSGGNSSAWDLLETGRMPNEINELRFGEAILLGRETAEGKSISAMAGDAFVIEAEIIEAIPSKPGHFIAAIGKQDIDTGSLAPVDSDWEIGKASSDHLVLRNNRKGIETGQTVKLIPGYESLLRAMTSPFVRKHYV
jgi:ornithine racemase